jgi:hypothetical protein
MVQNQAVRDLAVIGASTEVREGRVVAATEAVAIGVADRWGNRGMAEFSPSSRVGLFAPVEIVAGGFDAIVEALPLNVAEFRRGRIPAATIRRRRGWAAARRRWRWAVLCREKDGRCQGKGKRHKCEPTEFH